MKEEYRKAFKEVSQIISIMPENLRNLIPISFINIIEEEKSNDYNFIAKEPIENQELMQETKIILGLIYRDFLCSSEERKKLQIQDEKELQNLEEELKENYSIENIFNKRKAQNISQEVINNSMIIYEEKWYNKIWNIIKGIFKK